MQKVQLSIYNQCPGQDTSTTCASTSVNRQQIMPSRNLLLLLVIFMAQHPDMGVSSPIHITRPVNCPWTEFKHLTQNLYIQALKIYDPTNSTKDLVLDDIPRIECQHHCGPEHLVSHPETCLKRIFHVLSYYKSVLSTLPTSSQNEDFNKVKEIISDLLRLLQVCEYTDGSLKTPQTVTENFLKTKIGSPLLSVSIHIARVFSPGNPANHTIHPRH